MKKLGKLTLKEVKEIITTLSCSEQRNLMGGDVTITFDRSDGMIYIYGGGELQATFNAANNVDSHSQGIWSNGTYSMLDQSSTYTHGSNGGDTFEGTYGINGFTGQIILLTKMVAYVQAWEYTQGEVMITLIRHMVA